MQTTTPIRPLAPADRCPHRRPFPEGFDACPAHQAVAFVPTDTMHRPLRTELSCRHLATGQQPGAAGGSFYARCSLGSADERVRWLAMVTPARLEVMRALQEEFDAGVAAQRADLFNARAELLNRPESAARRRELEAALQAFLAAAAGFVAGREQRFEDVGLPAPALLRLVEDLCRSWAQTRPARSGDVAAELERFPVASQPFLQAVAQAPWHDHELAGRPVAASGSAPRHAARTWAEDEPLLDGVGLRMTRGAGGVVNVYGEVDARNADLFAETLRAALSGPADRHVDAGGLLFCAVSGLRALVRTAQRLDPGARLVVHGMPEQMRRAMQLVGWAEVPNLVFATCAANAAWPVRPYDSGTLSTGSDTYVDPAVAAATAPLPPPPRDAPVLAYDAVSLPSVRALVARCAARWGFASARVGDATLAVNEVAENSLRHGGGGTLRVWQSDGALVCDLRSSGRVADPLAGRVAPGDGVDGPRGLWLANALCDLVQIRTGEAGTAVRLHLRRRP